MLSDASYFAPRGATYVYDSLMIGTRAAPSVVVIMAVFV